jgi:osmotically-inducible protein OsmY
MSKNKDIREAVEAELTFDPLVDATDITVMNLNGDVALNGTVPSYPQYLEAAAVAQRIDGSRTCTTTWRSCCHRVTTAMTRC